MMEPEVATCGPTSDALQSCSDVVLRAEDGTFAVEEGYDADLAFTSTGGAQEEAVRLLVFFLAGVLAKCTAHMFSSNKVAWMALL